MAKRGNLRILFFMSRPFEPDIASVTEYDDQVSSASEKWLTWICVPGLPRHLLCCGVLWRCEDQAEVKSIWNQILIDKQQQQGLDSVQPIATVHGALHPVQSDHRGFGHLLLHEQPHHGGQEYISSSRWFKRINKIWVYIIHILIIMF